MTDPGFPERRGEQRDARRFGVLMPLTALPGREGIGTLGGPAERWLEWLVSAGASAWQLLPLGPPGLGNSPYSALSSFAGSPLLISVDRLAREPWAEAALALDRGSSEGAPGRVDYAHVARRQEERLRTLWAAFPAAPATRRRDFDAYRKDPRQAVWLADWTLFAALTTRSHRRGTLTGFQGSWLDWPLELRRGEPAALARARHELTEEIDYQTFVQFLFDEQLTDLRRAARHAGVELLGDLPFYPGLDSADVWSRADLFQLDEALRPTRIAGVPPDAFTDEGQLWGNALPRWHDRTEACHRWWIDRARASLRGADRLRLDHFRGFEAYWSIPAQAETAAEGHWEPGPGIGLFEAARRELGELPFFAEDLGVITDEVRELLERVGIPGMRVLQFAFAEGDSYHRPEAVPAHTVLCTATHDNDTARGWFEALEPAERERVLEAVAGTPETIHHDLLRAALGSRAEMVLAPVGDLLGLGSEARLNVPGEPVDQWTWRLSALPGDRITRKIRDMVEAGGRTPATSGRPRQNDS